MTGVIMAAVVVGLIGLLIGLLLGFAAKAFAVPVDEKEIEVIALSDQRRGAPEAQLLYQETAQSVKKREEMALARKNNALSMPHPDRRPNKKERRDLLKFKHQDEF